MRRDYALTFVAQGLVLASYLLVYRLVAHAYGPQGFSEYIVARRTLTLLVPFCLLGLEIAIPRLVAYVDTTDHERARRYVVAAIPISVVSVIAMTALILVVPGTVAQVFFGSADEADVARTLPLLLAGYTAHAIVYADLRGLHRMGWANTLLLVNHAAVPLATVTLGGDVIRILNALGGAWLACSAVALALSPRSVAHVRGSVRELLRLGLRRVPGDVIQLLLFGLPVAAVAQIGGLHDAGIVAFAMAALGLITQALTPVTVVLLPTASRMFGRGDVGGLRSHVVEVLRVVFPAVLVGVAAIELFADDILRLYLGPDFVAGSSVLRLVFVGALPWSAFVLLRSVVDARHEAAINARNLAIGGVSALVVAGILRLETAAVTTIVGGFVCGISVVGILTVYEARRSLSGAAALVAGGEVPEAGS